MNVTSNGVQIRVPAVANLMIDSADRPDLANSSAWDFLIAKNQSLFNGFFTRIGATEVVLEWQQPNVAAIYNNKHITFTVGGGTVVPVVLTQAFQTVEDILNAFVVALNAATTAARFSVINLGGVYGIKDSLNQPIVISVTPGFTGDLSSQLNLQGSGSSFIWPFAPDLRPYRYLDFVSSQLTYNQNLKDSTSNLIDQNVLVRWYFTYDQPTPSDGYGFPILMGYEPFYLRRIFNPPKQIAWENNMPIGQLSFQVIGSTIINDQIAQEQTVVSGLLSDIVLGNWLMTLQVSEN
jgi:hypothetical protein